jgi:hypothetical protein
VIRRFHITISTILMMITQCSFGQDTFLDTINDTIHSIKYVFEARIDSVHAFPADEFGNPIPFSKAEWRYGVGNFDNITYSKMYVTACRAYKGKLPLKFIILQPAPYVFSHAEINLNGDTTLGYISVPPSHGNYENSRLPSNGYPIKILFWCFDVKLIKNTANYYQVHNYFESQMGEYGSLLQADGSYSHEKIYAMLGTKWFLNQEELSNYLKQIKTLNANPKSKCN